MACRSDDDVAFGELGYVGGFNDELFENIGIERTYQKLQEAKIVLWLIDQQPTEAEIEDIKERVADKKLIIVRNKIDLHNSSLNNTSSTKPTILAQASVSTSRAQNTKLQIQNSQLVDISAKYGTNIPVLDNVIGCADASCVDKAELDAIDDGGVLDEVTGGAMHIAHDGFLFVQQVVE